MSDLPAFQQYQIAFTAHIRDPKSHTKPAKVNRQRMAVYREIVFNNIVGAVSACFPICKDIIGKRKWQKLCRQFFATYPATSPLFRDIPHAFLTFLNTQTELPSYLFALAHYEWAELAVSSMLDQTHTLTPTADLLNEIPVLANAHLLLHYPYAVQLISKKNPPKSNADTYICMFRNAAFQVKFIELNAITYQLLHLIQQENLTGKQALMQLASAMSHLEPEMIISFGHTILHDFMQQGVLIGSRGV